jgi:DNA (cytosine-5)-methyltransferase 1
MSDLVRNYLVAYNGNGNNYWEKKLHRLQQLNQLRVVDLFSGCGGLSLGFQRVGYEIIGGVERDAKAAKSHALNFLKDCTDKDFELHTAPVDITLTSPEQYMQNVLHAASPGNLVDVIIGGPPCQAFARIGRAKLRQIADHPEAYLNDNRASLYLHFMEYVDYFRPLAVLIENVPDILNFGGKNVAEEIASSLDELGYTSRYTILNTANYGVPQMRLRFFLIAFSQDLEIIPEFPGPTHSVELSRGYRTERSVVLKHIRSIPQLNFFDGSPSYFVKPPEAAKDLPSAVTVEEAIKDLPAITDHRKGLMKGGIKAFNKLVAYRSNVNVEGYIETMRRWPGFEGDKGIWDHVIRLLPRDTPIFERMTPGDEYPKAYAIAMELFAEELKRLKEIGENLVPDSKEYEAIKKKIVPPYDPKKFANKWWKLRPDTPCRTLTAHIGKDTYTHIHYDSTQARVISVREAARLQSFPDGFYFTGPMNDAFRQIGNSVPPLMAYALAKKIKELIDGAVSRITFEPTNFGVPENSSHE